jgi:hypothetical protein
MSLCGKPPPTFVHAGDVNDPVARKVTGDLNIADEWDAAGYLDGSPSGTVIRKTYEEGAAPDVKVVPGNIHPPKVRAGRVVVGPARLAVVGGVVVNGEMGPAIGIRGSRCLVPAEALTAGRGVEPHRIPGGIWLVIHNNGVAKGVGEGALPAGGRKAGEGEAAVGRNRGARNVDGDGIETSRVVVGDHYFEWVVWISRGHCLRLGNIGKALGARDQVDVGATIGQRRQQLLGNWVRCAESGSGAARCLAAINHDRSGPQVFLPVDA